MFERFHPRYPTTSPDLGALARSLRGLCTRGWGLVGASTREATLARIWHRFGSTCTRKQCVSKEQCLFSESYVCSRTMELQKLSERSRQGQAMPPEGLPPERCATRARCPRGCARTKRIIIIIQIIMQLIKMIIILL